MNERQPLALPLRFPVLRSRQIIHQTGIGAATGKEAQAEESALKEESPEEEPDTACGPERL